MKQYNNIFDIAGYPVIFDTPERIVEPLSWVQHIPFAFFIVELLKPRLFVELGTHSGNSYNSVCQAVRKLNLSTKCFAVDTWKGDFQSGLYDESVFVELNKYQQTWYNDFSTLLRMTFDNAVCDFGDGVIDLLHIDGCHTYQSVKHDFETWLPKMSTKGVILFHDTNEKQANYGVWKLWDELSKKYPCFNFGFGHGLGVLVVGTELTVPMIQVLDEFKRNNFYNNFFEALGLLTELRHLSKIEDAIKTKFVSKLFVETIDENISPKNAVNIFFNGSPEKLVFDVSHFEGIRSFRFQPLNEAVVLEIGNIQTICYDNTSATCNISGDTALNSGEKRMIFESNNQFIFFDNPLPSQHKVLNVIIHLHYISKDKSAMWAIIKHKSEKVNEILTKLHRLNLELTEEKQQNIRNLGIINRFHSIAVNKEQIIKLTSRLVVEKNSEIRNLLAIISEKNNKLLDKEDVIIRLAVLNEEKEKLIQRLEIDLGSSRAELINIKKSKAFRYFGKFQKIYYRIRPFSHFKGFDENSNSKSDLSLIESSGLFNGEFYIKNNPDIDFTKISPAQHYLIIGGFQNRNPGPDFNSQLYLHINSDVALTGINPLLHYLKFGKQENRRIEPMTQVLGIEDSVLQSEVKQDAINKPSQDAEINNLAGIQQQIQLIRESGIFNEKHYLQCYPDVRISMEDPIAHYVKYGSEEDRNPSEYFDTAFYRKMWLDSSKDINPLTHWLTEGKSKGYYTSTSSANSKAGYESSVTDILFISHDASVTGAPKILLDIIGWVKANTMVTFKILLLHGGPWISKFMELGNCMIFSEIRSEYSENEARRLIDEFIGDRLKVVYLNTVVTIKDFNEVIGEREVPAICHVHELQKTFEFFNITKDHFSKKIKCYIAASQPVKKNLVQNFNVAEKNVAVIYEWVAFQDFIFTSDEKMRIKKELGLPPDKKVVFGSGTFDHRKGADIFIDVANHLIENGYEDFLFCWIGDIYNDFGNETIGGISGNKLNNYFRFLGMRENPARCFLAGDIFLLPSREDPFPLVCLEAANARLPIICFDEAGGMPWFVEEDAGFVVPFENAEIMAERVGYLINNDAVVRQMGDCAYRKCVSQFTSEFAIPKVFDILKITGRIKPKVSVIIPNYNYGCFLKKRLDSIFYQTFVDFEVIILDDASNDNSLEIINNFRKLKNVKVFVNKENSRSAFLQWAKGIEIASGDFIWLAEADDYCEKDFLHSVIKAFDDPEIAISYANSNMVDDEDKVTGNYNEYYHSLDTNHWLHDHICWAEEEINFGLGVKNTIPNASAMVFRKDENTLKYLKDASHLTFSGDWFFYLQLIKGKKISFIQTKLNYHRKHDNSITNKVHEDSNKHIILDELVKIHRHILENFRLNNTFHSRWDNYVNQQIAYLFPLIGDKNKVYPYDEISGSINERQQRRLKSVIFVSNTADSSGAPQNLLALVRHFYEFGHYHCITLSLIGGILLGEFTKYGEVYVINPENTITEKNLQLSEFINTLPANPEFVLVNTISCGYLIPVFKGVGLKVVTFIHDYTYALSQKNLAILYEMSDLIVFSTEYMRQFNAKDYEIPMVKTTVIPQGLYKENILKIDSSDFRKKKRDQFFIKDNDCVVLGCGSLDARKGVDIFISTAIQCLNDWNDRRGLHFFWLGGELKSNSDNFYHRFLARDIINSGQEKNIHFIESTIDVAPFFVLADLFFLSSREDPFPTVVHEAMAAGLQIIGFNNAGGAGDYILRAGGKLVNYQDTHEAAQTIIEMLKVDSVRKEEIRRIGKEIVTNELSYMNYFKNILSFLNMNKVINDI